MNDFTPKKRSDVVTELKNALLNGNIIRYDGYHTEVEVLPRAYASLVKHSDNLFQRSGILYSYYNNSMIEKKRIPISGSALYGTIKEIGKEYVLAKVRCNGSGCCQYATWAVYLQ